MWEFSEPSCRSNYEYYWDEYLEDEHVSISRPENFGLKWDKDVEISGQIDTFILLQGKYLTDCMKTQKESFEIVDTISKANLVLYRSKNDSKYICTVMDYDVVWSSVIVEMLRKYLTNCKFAMTIQTQPQVEYIGENLCSGCEIRTVSTGNVPSDLCSFPKLEQPNFISGVPAGVMTFRLVENKPGLALIVYLDDAEEFKVSEIGKLLVHLNILDKPPRSNLVQLSNLYM